MKIPALAGAGARLSVALAAGAVFALSGGAAFAAGPGGHPAAADAEAPFLAENDRAMTRMMDDMSIEPTGDVDRDFVGMMAPHHQGAIDMAQAELRYGHNEQLRRLAQEIIVEQQQEIVAMRLALGDALPPAAPAPDQDVPTTPVHGMPTHMHMSTPMSTTANTNNAPMRMDMSKETP
ncbi:DUF305 family protein family protein [Paraburkholderia sp. BL8N3]|jgi:hypothetical protein|nr:DUF305 domain-containing protein [Paraburkholderia sp. BL8N3]TCK38947.1 DUF305 family protein family protein [Paraburkholderia sp. BL8N3]